MARGRFGLSGQRGEPHLFFVGIFGGNTIETVILQRLRIKQRLFYVNSSRVADFDCNMMFFFRSKHTPIKTHLAATGHVLQVDTFFG